MLFCFSALSHECHYLLKKTKQFWTDSHCLCVWTTFLFTTVSMIIYEKQNPQTGFPCIFLQSLVKFKSILGRSVIYKYTIENTNSVLAKQLCCHFCPVRNLWTKETDASRWELYCMQIHAIKIVDGKILSHIIEKQQGHWSCFRAELCCSACKLARQFFTWKLGRFFVLEYWWQRHVLPSLTQRSPASFLTWVCVHRGCKIALERQVSNPGKQVI